MAFLNETGLKIFLNNCDNRYLKLTGGTTTGRIYNNRGGSWIQARNNCAIFKGRAGTDTGNYYPVISMATSNGVWSLGSRPGTNDELNFTYDTNANYNSGTNQATSWTLRTNGQFTAAAYTVYGNVAVANGGTGATTWKAARENLGTYASTSAPSNQAASWAGTIWVQY